MCRLYSRQGRNDFAIFVITRKLGILTWDEAFLCLRSNLLSESFRAKYCELIIGKSVFAFINTLSAKDGDLRLSASNACLPKTEISVFVTECVFFTSTCYTLHMFTLHDVLYS